VIHRVLKEKPVMNYHPDKNQFSLPSPAKLNVQQVHLDLKGDRVHLETVVMLEKEVPLEELVPQANLEMKEELECQEKLEDLVS